MSRSGYGEEIDNWSLIKWRGQVASAIRGRRGQEFLKDLLLALDAMPQKALIAHELEREDGQVCALGSLGKARRMNMQALDPDEPDDIAAAFGIAPPLAQEIVHINDEAYGVSREQRWKIMRDWVASNIIGNQT